MTVVQAVVLGTIQGLTEFLPISSSGHLVFIPKIFGWEDQGLPFDVVAHLGTLLAVIVYFRRRIFDVLGAFVGKGIRSKEKGISDLRRLGWLIILTIIPAGLAGLLFNDWIETNLRAAWIVGAGMIFWGIILGVADYLSRQHFNTTTPQHLNWRKALFIGCAQVIALIPGTSRSGITMTAGLFSKLDKKSAAEFSFLMSVPIIALAGAMESVKLVRIGLGDLSLLVLTTGFVASAMSGFAAIWGLMKIIQRWSFMPFVMYRVIVGVAILLWVI